MDYGIVDAGLMVGFRFSPFTAHWEESSECPTYPRAPSSVFPLAFPSSSPKSGSRSSALPSELSPDLPLPNNSPNERVICLAIEVDYLSAYPLALSKDVKRFGTNKISIQHMNM